MTKVIHEDTDNWPCLCGSTKAEKALRRKCVLDTYGVTIENLANDFDRWLEIVSSNDRLAEWFGYPLPHYILSELEALEGT
jgi:hypothetical protein